MKKYKVWFLSFGVSLLVAGLLYSASNDFTDIWTLKIGNAPVVYVDSGGNLNLVNNLVATGSSTIRIISSAAPRTSVTPSGVGQLVFNTTDNQICVSTGATATTWAVVGSTYQVLACLH